MAHWKSMMEREYLFAFDLKERDVTLTIDRVVGGTLVGSGGKKSKKPLCYFRERTKEGEPIKPLALNATNCKAIAGMYGNDADAWAGKRVTLYPTTTQMGGETVECIRVRPKIPAGKGAPAEEQPEPGADG